MKTANIKRNCAISFKRKWTAWNKRQDKTTALAHKQILLKVIKAPFVTRENGTNSIMVNLSITIKSNQFVGIKYRASDFLKKQKNK